MLLVFLVTVCQEKDLRWESLSVSQHGVCSYSGAAGRFAHSGSVKSVDAPTWGRGRGSAGSCSWALLPPVHGVEGACAWGGRREMHGVFTVHSL